MGQKAGTLGNCPALLCPYVIMDWMIPRTLAMQTARLASSRAFANAGSNIDTRIAIIDITTSSSINVKAEGLRRPLATAR
jgi:hypothetical protein